MSRELVTVTVLRKDVEDAISDIHLSHADRCLSSDGCDCMARAGRLSAALEQDARSKTIRVEGDAIIAAGGWCTPSAAYDFGQPSSTTEGEADAPQA